MGGCWADWANCAFPLAKDSRRSSGALPPSGRFRHDLQGNLTVRWDHNLHTEHLMLRETGVARAAWLWHAELSECGVMTCR